MILYFIYGFLWLIVAAIDVVAAIYAKEIHLWWLRKYGLKYKDPSIFERRLFWRRYFCLLAAAICIANASLKFYRGFTYESRQQRLEELRKENEIQRQKDLQEMMERNRKYDEELHKNFWGTPEKKEKKED